MRRLILAVTMITALAAIPLTGFAAEDAPAKALTLARALEKTLSHHPGLKVTEMNKRVKAAERLQAGLRPNPELDLEAENFAGSGPYSGLDSLETTLTVGQRLELGGKRNRRVQLAGLEEDLADWDQTIQRQSVLGQAYLAFIDVLAAQQDAALSQELFQLAGEVDTLVKARVEAGKISPLEAVKSEVAAANAQFHWQQAQSKLQAHRLTLSGFWGRSAPDFGAVTGHLETMDTLPPLAVLTTKMADNPEMVRLQTQKAHRNAGLALAKAEAVPDLTLKGGFRTTNESNDTGWVIGASMPLPLFNRNQGNIQRARHQVTRADLAGKATENRIRVALSERWQALKTAYDQTTTLHDRILPAAERAFDGISEGFKAGKFSYLDVLDAQRTYFEARVQYTGVLAELQRQKVILEQQIGRDLRDVALGEWFHD